VPQDPVELNDRQREILQAVVEDYIATAEPVGSRTLTKRNRGIDVSPATVRNTMADLEDLGYLSAPHASAGRIPTARAIRVYVEQLARRGKISPRDRELINAIASPGGEANRDVTSILRDASRALSTLSHHATFVLLPRLDEVVFAEIEFVPVRADSVLALFVAKSGLVQHRVLPVDFACDRDELRRMSSYLKSLLDGKTLTEVRVAIIEAMRDERAQADAMMRRALLLGERSLTSDEEPGANVLVDGERNFLDQPEFSDIAKMRGLLRAFEEKTVLLRLLTTAIENPLESQLTVRAGTHFGFGADAAMREAKDLAMVAATYSSSGGPEGHVGVVGPLRMDYARLVPLVEYTAGVLSTSFASPGANPAEPPPDGQNEGGGA